MKKISIESVKKRKELYDILLEMICDNYNIPSPVNMRRFLMMSTSNKQSYIVGIFLLTCKNLTGLSIREICSYYASDYLDIASKWSYQISTNHVITKKAKNIENDLKFKLLEYEYPDKNM